MNALTKATGWLAWHARRRMTAWQRGAIYGLRRPAWWPRAWSWGLGPQSALDGKLISLFFAGKRHDFEPATFGRYRGHRYAGALFPDVPLMETRLRRLHLPVAAARGMVAVSQHEGGFDSLQTYDRAKLSWGFIQFAALGGLPALLQHIAQSEPALFERYFRSHGILCDSDRISVMRDGRRHAGRQALDALHDTPHLWKAFIIAAQDEAIQDAQIKVAYERYYAHALKQKLTLGANQFQLGEIACDDAYIEAVFFDRAVDLGLVAAIQLFQRAARTSHAQGLDEAATLLHTAQQLDFRNQRRWESLRLFFGAQQATPMNTHHE